MGKTKARMVVKAQFSSSALQVENSRHPPRKKTIYDLILTGCSLHHADDPTSLTSSSCNTPPSLQNQPGALVVGSREKMR
ncbi:hypothetical protein TNCT_488901 [Trichonephila clavata]|uniref:Uncharacterized protein n=1 Tax=Trichonephila clavata TaxID=2740835 RepID=A0A8X6IYA4_TRICU|nr:hypothetical protein TNCT_488901 [Trichonephila clavata]